MSTVGPTVRFAHIRILYVVKHMYLVWIICILCTYCTVHTYTGKKKITADPYVQVCIGVHGTQMFSGFHTRKCVFDIYLDPL